MVTRFCINGHSVFCILCVYTLFFLFKLNFDCNCIDEKFWWLMSAGVNRVYSVKKWKLEICVQLSLVESIKQNSIISWQFESLLLFQIPRYFQVLSLSDALFFMTLIYYFEKKNKRKTQRSDQLNNWFVVKS